MKRLMDFFRHILEIMLGICGFLLVLVAPRKCKDPKKRKIVEGRNFAHRGLHTKDMTIPENSLPAFARAVDHGYGIELDLQLTKDNQIVVFHDETLDRVCHVHGKVIDFTYEQLKEFRLQNTEYTIPLFSEVLKVVDGKIPMIVEFKDCRKKNRLLCKKAYKMLKEYDGEYCVESFQPWIVFWFRIHAPHILRGQLSALAEDFEEDLGPKIAYLQGNLMFNLFSRPNFIAYDKAILHPEKVKFPVRQAPYALFFTKLLGGMQVVWTVRTEDELEYFQKHKDCVIFEFLEPDIRFK